MNAIVDCGMGNVGVIHNMFRRIGVESAVTDSVESIRAADQLVLPGVGAFDAGMERINPSGASTVRFSVSDAEQSTLKIPPMGWKTASAAAVSAAAADTTGVVRKNTA
jgi:imidazoleglycerol phosphate synthase glutamine amidotransferase subunit HisH